MEFLTKSSFTVYNRRLFLQNTSYFVSQGYEYASDKTKQNPGVLSFFSTQSLQIHF